MTFQFALFISAFVLVSAGCLVPNSWLPPLPNDKLLHFLGYGGVAALGLPVVGDRSQGILLLGGILLASLIIEYLQNYVPERKFCWRDMAANAAGISAAGLGALAYTELIAGSTS